MREKTRTSIYDGESFTTGRGVQVPAGRCMCDTGICEDPAPKGCANPTTGERCRFLYAAQGVSARDGLCFRPDGPCPDFQCRVCAYFRHGQIDVLGWLLKVPTLPTKLREKHVKGIRLNNMKTDFETVHRSMLAFLANGRLLIPLGECDNFDHRQQGCMGHGIRDDQQDARKTEILRAKEAIDLALGEEEPGDDSEPMHGAGTCDNCNTADTK